MLLFLSLTAGAAEPTEAQHYTTADRLSLRAQPSASATRNNVIPFGTQITTVGPTEHEGRMWYHVPSVAGYVVADFVSDTVPAEDKKMVLNVRDDNGLEFSHTVLFLAQGRVTQWTWREDPGGVRCAIEDGSYSVGSGRIEVTINKPSCADRPTQCPTKAYLYSAPFNAFLTETQSKAGWRAEDVDRDKCAHAYQTDCSMDEYPRPCTMYEGFMCTVNEPPDLPECVAAMPAASSP